MGVVESHTVTRPLEEKLDISHAENKYRSTWIQHNCLKCLVKIFARNSFSLVVNREIVVTNNLLMQPAI